MKILELTPEKVTLAKYGFGKGTITRHRSYVKRFIVPEQEIFRALTDNYLLETALAECQYKGTGAVSASRKRRRVRHVTSPEDDVLAFLLNFEALAAGSISNSEDHG